ncbi:MAG: PDZ domain-containing protein [Vicinamibacterales bacterium]
MRFWNACGTALILGSAALTMPAASTAHAQAIRHERGLLAPVQRAFEVLNPGAGSRIGVSIEDVAAEDVASRKLASQSGALITTVEEGTPAEEAGFRAGDVVLEFDGERVRSARQLTRLVQETPAGRKVAVTVSRDGQRVNLTVEPESAARVSTFTPGVRVDAAPAPRAPRARAPQVFRTPAPEILDLPEFETFRGGFAFSFGGGRLGVSTQTLREQLAKHFGVERGVLVTEVVENSAASKAGIRAGDVITKVNGTAIDDAGDLARALGDKNGDVTIELVRDRKPQTLKATIEASRTRTYRRII